MILIAPTHLLMAAMMVLPLCLFACNPCDQGLHLINKNVATQCVTVDPGDNSNNHHAVTPPVVQDIALLQAKRRLILAEANVSRISFSPSGRFFSGRTIEGQQVFFEAQTGARQFAVYAAQFIDFLGWTPDEALLGFGAFDQVLLLDASTAAETAVMRHPFGFVQAWAWSPLKDKIAIAGSKKLYIWDYASNALITELTGHADNISALLWHAHKGYLVSADQEGKAMVWQTETWQSVTSITLSTVGIASLLWLGQGEQIAIGMNNLETRIFDVDSWRLQQTVIRGWVNPITQVVADQPVAAEIRFYSLLTGANIGAIALSSHDNEAVAVWSQDGRHLAVVADHIEFWELDFAVQ